MRSHALACARSGDCACVRTRVRVCLHAHVTCAQLGGLERNGIVGVGQGTTPRHDARHAGGHAREGVPRPREQHAPVRRRHARVAAVRPARSSHDGVHQWPHSLPRRRTPACWVGSTGSGVRARASGAAGAESSDMRRTRVRACVRACVRSSAKAHGSARHRSGRWRPPSACGRAYVADIISQTMRMH
jgi:hypothetical protein